MRSYLCSLLGATAAGLVLGTSAVLAVFGAFYLFGTSVPMRAVGDCHEIASYSSLVALTLFALAFLLRERPPQRAPTFSSNGPLERSQRIFP